MDRDHLMLQKLLELAKKTDIKDPYKIPYEITKETDMWFLILPQWSHFLPPFNLARLSSVLLQEGFYTRCLDLNIKAWNIIRPQVDNLGYDPWDGTKAYKWKGDIYFNELHSYFEELFNAAIETVVAANPKVIGFTAYWTNHQPTIWVKNKLKERLPDTLFIVGGPSSQSDADILSTEFDIVVVGEAEKIIVDVLTKVENKEFNKEEFPLVLTQPFKERLDLNIYPIPNYSDFDTNEYEIPNGTISEFSRGCVAKCTFCEETHFWNYRQKGYLSLVNELEHLNKNYGFEGVWFVDSLVNGSLKELYEFAKEVIKRDIKIKWFGYARHDKRMDLEYLTTLRDSGCIAFQYGSESGSNKVLEDMKKRVTKEDMEQNFIDGAKVGIQAVTGWVIGFPTEEINDFVDTMTLIFRNRETSITNLVVSQRFHMGAQTIVGQNPERFNLLPFNFDGCFLTKDHSLGKPQLLIRSKTWSIFQEELKSKKKIQYQSRPNLKKYHYEIQYDIPNLVNEIEFEEFDYSIINTGNAWQDGCLNQPFGLFRFLWRTRGGFKMKLKFEPEMDFEEYGPSLANNLSGYFNFKIDRAGKWACETDLKFIQKDRPFSSFPESFYLKPNAATLRARKLAYYKDVEQDTVEDKFERDKILAEEYNNTKDFSFHYKDSFTGNWGLINKSLF